MAKGRKKKLGGKRKKLRKKKRARSNHIPLPVLERRAKRLLTIIGQRKG